MYNGYPVVTRENGMICARTELYDGKVLEECQTDPNPPEPAKSDKETIWYSATELRKAYDDRYGWYEALYS